MTNVRIVTTGQTGPSRSASATTFTPASGIAATDVQAAVVEVAGDVADLSSATTTALALKAPLASPALTGTPTAPTAATSTSTTQLATTAFVQQERAAQAATDSSQYLRQVKSTDLSASDGAVNATVIQAALDAVTAAGGGLVRVPAGTWPLSTGLVIDMNNGSNVNMGLVGEGIGATHFDYTGSGIGIKQADDGTRRYNLVLRDFSITDTGTGTTGIDLDSISTGYFERVNVAGFTTAWRLRSAIAGGCTYNRFVACLANTATVGWSVETDGSNENTWIACRANSCSGQGVKIVDSNHNVWLGGSIESCGDGWYVDATSNGLSDTNTAIGIRLEGNTTGVNMASANVRNNAILYPHPQGNTTDITDNGTRTTYMAGSAGIQLSGVPYYVKRAAAADDALRVQVAGDAEYRLVIDADGTIWRGNGTVAPDLSIGYSSSGPSLTLTAAANLSVGTGAGLTSAKMIVTPTATSQRGLLIRGIASAAADYFTVQTSASADLLRVSENGHTMIKVNTAPADADLATSEVAFWFDNTAGAAKMMFKGKNSSGTVVSGSVALT